MLKFSNHIGWLCFLVFGSLAIVALSSPLRAQDLRKWMSNVGDRFVYYYVYSDTGYSYGSYGFRGKDTLTEEIISIDSATGGDTSWHVVVITDSITNSAFSTTGKLISFHAGTDPNSSHSLMINISSSSLPLDFSDSRDSQTEFGTKWITAYYSDSATVVPGQQENGFDSVAALYSLDLRWFFYRTEHFYSPPPGMFGWANSFYTQTLVAADLSGVNSLRSDTSLIFVQVEGSLLQLQLNVWGPLTLTLLDPLGRTVRLWQFGVGGSRQISLNVADVPSGVYFLRVSGEGIDDVKKVCIAH